MCKSGKVDDTDEEYIPSVAGGESDEDNDFFAAELSGDELMPGDFEVEDLSSNIVVVKGLVMSEEQVESLDDRVIALYRCRRTLG